MPKSLPPRPIKPWENLTLEQQAALTEDFKQLKLKAEAELKAAEIAKRPKRDQVCRTCNVEIPHGTEFVAISRYVTRGHVHNPNFIGKQPVAYGIETEVVGALCLSCVGVSTSTPTQEPR